MMHPAADIRTLLQPGKRVHLAGIGGVSMCALAEVLQGMGLVVQGSDMTESDTVRHLRSLGIQVAIGHSAENLKNCDAVIRTAAIHDSNPEIAGAIARGIPVYERAQAWGGIMRGYRNALCVSGTHGKTTTTSMATHIFMAAQKDPTVMIGGTLPLLHAGYRVGQGDTIILESCEYCNSFLSFFPTVAVILNVHADHLDFFKDLADIQHSFRRFAELVPPAGSVIVNADSKVEDLSVEQIAKIFTGEITDWSEVGGDAGTISCIGREAGSGTRDGFESITDTKDACQYRQELTSTGDVITTVSQNPNAIGYASLAAIKDSVKALTVNGVAPTEATVKDGTYLVQRPFVLVTKEGVALSETAQKFFDFATSADAASIISAAGAVPVA